MKKWITKYKTLTDIFTEIKTVLSKDDSVYEITLRKKSSKRSTNQNSLYWKIVAELANHLGYLSSDSLHEDLKDHLGLFESRTDYVSKTQVVKSISTKHYTKKEFNEYLEKVIVFATESGLKLPDNL